MNAPAMRSAARTGALLFALCLAAASQAATLRVGATGGGGKSYPTLSEALKNLQPGDELVIAPGIYREALLLPERDWGNAATVIRGAPGGAVVIKGSDLVEGWEPLRGGVFVKRQWRVNSQQVFVDGEPLQQIGGSILNGYPDKPGHPMKALHAAQGGIWPGRIPGGRDQLVENSFYYDLAEQSLYIKLRRDSLAGRSVEVSVRPYLLFGKGLKNVSFRDLRFQHANTTALNQSGAITLLGDDLLLERIGITQTDGNGMDLTGNRITVRASSANYCGQTGMKLRGRGNRILDSETSYNNTRGFNKWWEAGGAKFVGDGGLRDSEIANHRAIGNHGDGLWFDWLNDNNQVHHSIVAYNTGFGIHYEASRRAQVHDNYVFGNGQRGIYLPNSPDSVVAHNLVAMNGMEGIALVNERPPSRPEITARAARIVGNVLAWNGRAAVVLPDTDANVSDYNVYLHDADPPSFSLGWGSLERPLRKGLEDWKSASGQDAHSRSERLALPAGLRKALDAKELAPDWSPVLSDAEHLGVRLDGEAAGPAK
jgi:parallel beta-helix repeat protein